MNISPGPGGRRSRRDPRKLHGWRDPVITGGNDIRRPAGNSCKGRSDGGCAFKRSRHKRRRKILVIDVGGSHVKMKLGKGSIWRQFKSGRSSAPRTWWRRSSSGPEIGPTTWYRSAIRGPVTRQRPIAEPHNLRTGWAGFDTCQGFSRLVVNDAVLQALGDYCGGRMLFLGLGTGLGSAIISRRGDRAHGARAPPVQKRQELEYYLGNDGMKRFGLKKWRAHVADAIEMLRAALEPGYIVIGGGNARKLKTLPPHTLRGDNERAFVGGLRLWDKHAAND